VFPWFVGVGDVGERATERHIRMDGKRSLLCVSLFYPKTVLVCSAYPFALPRNPLTFWSRRKIPVSGFKLLAWH